MGGGSMDYVYSKIYEAARQAKEYRRDIAAKPVEDFEFDANRIGMSPEELKIKVLQYFDNGIVKLREAETYAHRIEWLTSDDDGYDDFIKETDEDLAELARTLGMTLEPPKPYVVSETRDALASLVDAVEYHHGLLKEDDDDDLGIALRRAKELLGDDGE